MGTRCKYLIPLWGPLIAHSVWGVDLSKSLDRQLRDPFLSLKSYRPA